ncbi:carboxypeptidase Y [Akanthomyces lecanii RCEF 1005]|uniref:Carboxypeptidase Y n=1 Tax=Akanthomyces lecanii RCEF 1005 TaxID=1081108 RepID=A0A168DNI3_CORDF|nr:carboxypeptidase Y [Akanthomyces lecanii RCEF 1005]
MRWTYSVVLSLLSPGLAKPTSPYHSNAAWDFTATHNKIERAAEPTKSAFSNYALRGRTLDSSALGVDTVKQYAGYLDDNERNKHLLYWFFESRNDLSKDPLIL